jgi:hypothetical protein
MVLDLVSYITDNLRKAVQKNRDRDRLPQRSQNNQLPSNNQLTSNDQMSKKQRASMLDPKAKEFYPKNFQDNNCDSNNGGDNGDIKLELEVNLESELESEKILYEQKKLVDKVVDYVLIDN